ncbi:MAG TPA: proline dehydrogenase family protein [Rhodocyclaceae bacterium]|nr:proline dehydrogenase family protein [Rhodocyclaceae bacterium]
MPATDEGLVHHIASALLHSARQHKPRIYNGVSGQVLRRCLDDAPLRAALFRFIDVLPQLQGSAAQAAHLRAYLDEAGSTGLLPGLMKLSARPSLSWLATLQIRHLAQNFLVEETPRALALVLNKLAALPATVTLDAVGEAVLTEAEADAYRDRVLWQLQQDWCAKHGQRQAPHLSIKLTALAPGFDPLDAGGTRRRVYARLTPILELAAERQATVTIDMEHHELKQQIVDLFLDAVVHFNDPRWQPAIALQAYLPETRDDLSRVLEAAQRSGRRLGVRLVKGAYWDQEHAWALERGWPMPCYLDKAATDANYEALTAILLARTDTLHVAIAGHNPRSLAVAIAHARQAGLTATQWEIQMLHGMAEPLRDALIEQDVPLRIYVPTGDLLSGMAYLIRRLLENTAGTSILRQTWLDEAQDAALLQRPAPPVPSASTPVSAPPPTLPLSDFSRPEVRAAFQRALDSMQAQLSERPATGAERYQSRNPHAPQQILGSARMTPLNEVDAIIAAARAAQRGWAARPVVERVNTLSALADHIDAARHHFAAIQVLEAGKPWREADADVAEAIDFLRYYGAQMLALSGDHATVDFPGERNRYCYRPRGLAVVIAPWNFPLAILTGMTAAALVTGNAALIKPALPGLQSALALRAAMDAVGIPRDVCPLLIGDADLGRALVAHSAVEIIAFTGSRAVGLDILHEAHTPRSGQRHIKQVVCEMGGKNAIVVDADADLDEAVGGILASAFGYSGQKCSACSRVIAVEAIAPSLQQRLVAAAATLRWGDPADPSCDHGPLISAAARQKALDYIAIGGQEAHLLWQGSVPQGDGSGWYCPPTIFTEVRPEHRIAREEIFGPVLALMTAPDFATALAIANNCDYALTGGVYSRLPRHLALARDEFRVGNLYLNRRTTGARVGVQPFGGIALSGTGIQAGGPDYLKQFMWMQSSSENIMRKGFVPGGE